MTNEEQRMVDALATVIRMELAGQGMSQKDLAEKVGVTRSALNRYLQGVREMPINLLIRIAEALGMSLTEIVTAAEQRLR